MVLSFFRRVRERAKSFAAGRRGTVFHIRHDAERLRVDWLSTENERGEVGCEWREVRAVVAYKRDLFAHDRLHLQFELDDGTGLEVDEGMAGWDGLIEKLPAYLRGCHPPAEWWAAVALPAFAENATQLYSRPHEEKA